MKYLRLVWFGVWRKPARTVLIFLQVAVAFALFGVLQGLKTGVDYAIRQTRADLLLVFSRLSMGQPLPLASLTQIKTVPGVRVAIPVDLLGGTYQKPNQWVLMVAVGPDKDWTSAFTFQIPPASLAAFQNSRTAALATEEIATRYGWKIGDRIPLESTVAQTDGSMVWTFHLVGLFHDSDIGGGTEKILIQYPYLDAARVAQKGIVNHFNVAIQDPRMAPGVADEIDRRFANSANETRTQSLQELAQLNMQSLRERTPELAVLKTLGFTDGAVLLLILTEAMVVCVAAALFGLALAMVAFPLASKIVPGLSMPPIVIAVGVALAVAVSFISAAVPALRAARLQIATALTDR